MSESRPTPGPWETSKHQQGDLEDEWGVYPPLGARGPVALVAGEANARLIAAAPELLEACKAAYSALGFPIDDESLNRVTNQLSAAIAKAEARS